MKHIQHTQFDAIGAGELLGIFKTDTDRLPQFAYNLYRESRLFFGYKFICVDPTLQFSEAAGKIAADDDVIVAYVNGPVTVMSVSKFHTLLKNQKEQPVVDRTITVGGDSIENVIVAGDNNVVGGQR